jgi:cholesterol oxidase
MTFWISRPFEELEIAAAAVRTHTLIVGSGYGAAFAALALALRTDKPYQNSDIMVLERGRERVPGEFPKTISDLPAEVSIMNEQGQRTGYADALFDVRRGANVSCIIGSGLGGTSLINASVAVAPTAEVVAGWPTAPSQPSWLERLEPSVGFVKAVLAVQQHPHGLSLPKVRALAKLARAIERSEHQLAELAVNFKAGSNAAGVRQPQCNDCGNCFTGCNIGAKSTLAMNAWPLAQRLGVRIHTGGRVLYLARSDDATHPWCVTAQATGKADGAPTHILAQRVILAAGTFGSTEILQRSKTLGSSATLGGSFSLNGDGVAFGFGQRTAIAAHAKVPSDASIEPQVAERPGPTIVSMIRAGSKDQRMLLEDATVPQALTPIWGELLTTQAMTHGYVVSEPSAWHAAHPSSDPLSVNPELLQHHQVILAMGVDAALGRLQLGETGTVPHWPGPAASSNSSQDPHAAAKVLHDTLMQAHANGGFDGGLYLSNPFWKPLPEQFEQVFEGAANLGGAHFSNHPLGGCTMHTDAAHGVVSTTGEVFAGSAGTATHAGLYVLDGSTLPGALGINPFLTIAALAHHLATTIDGPAVAEQFVIPAATQPISVRTKPGRQLEWPPAPRPFVFRERLFGPADDAQASAIGAVFGSGPAVANGIVIDAELSVPNIEAWAADPRQTLPMSATVHLNSGAPKTLDTIEEAWLEALMNGTGKVQLFATDAKLGRIERWRRAALAIRRMWQLRGDELKNFSTAGQYSAWQRLRSYLRVAVQHSHWRYLDYRLRCSDQSRDIEIHGTKTLAYRPSSYGNGPDSTAANPWTALTNIELHFVNRRTGARASGRFRVDLVRMAKNLSPLQVAGSAETPQVLLSVAALGGLALRALLQTHLWSFGAPRYKSFPQRAVARAARLAPPPQTIAYQASSGQREFDCAIVKREPHWRLLRANANARTQTSPVLLIHGLAHSSRVFYTETVARSLAGYLMNEGYEVWMLDHGLSTALDLPDYDPCIDEIALQVTAALHYVYQSTASYRQRGNAVKVFSHCVGSVATTMSILSGNSQLKGETLIESLVMHAVPPWIHPSESNLLRAYIGVFFKDRFFPKSIDPIPCAEDAGEPGNVLLDRIAGSLPWSDVERAHHAGESEGHFARTVCNRMTAFYGYEWLHANLDERTHRQLHSLVGPASSRAFRHLYFLLYRRRVTDEQGRNVYMQTEAFERHWNFHTMFLHGTHNQVFDAESSRRSAHQLGLVAIRANQQLATYCVKYQPVEGYGHMDVLFGKQAWRDVFPHIAAHFQLAPAPLSECPQPRLIGKHAPKTSILAPTTVKSGPVISRPRRVDGRLQLRVWCETNEFQTSKVEDVVLRCPGVPKWRLSGQWNVKRGPEQRQQPSGNKLRNSLFWVGDFDCEDIDSGVLPVVVLDKYGFESKQQPAPVDLEPERGAPDLPDSMRWHDLAWFARAQQPPATPALAFVCGSCWYPGTWFDRDVADRVFAHIRDHVRGPNGIDHLLLLGDQIYADATAAIFDIAEHRERYQESYRRAFTSRNAKWVLQHVPTYFAIDDHEFNNDYAGSTAQAELGRAAREEAWNFQMHHRGTPTDQDHQLYYSFTSVGFQFLVIDTRSERCAGTATGLDRLMYSAQQRALEQWLAAHASDERPLFIACGSPPMALPEDEINHPSAARGSDTLRAYPELLAFIARTAHHHGCRQKIVLLGGDLHYSSISEFDVLSPAGQPLASFVCIIASGLNAPLPFANERPDKVDWNAPPLRHTPSGVDSPIEVHRWSLLSTSRAHAVRVDVRRAERWELQVQVIDADSSSLHTEKVYL